MSYPTGSKFVIRGETILDLTSDNVSAEKMLSGTTAHDKSGASISGTIAEKQLSDVIVDGPVVTIPAGVYSKDVIVTVLWQFAPIVDGEQVVLVDESDNRIGGMMRVPNISRS